MCIIFFKICIYFRVDAQQKNENLEFERNKERFTFLKVFQLFYFINILIFFVILTVDDCN